MTSSILRFGFDHPPKQLPTGKKEYLEILIFEYIFEYFENEKR